MRTFYAMINGINPVGACAVLLARDKREAFYELQRVVNNHPNPVIWEKNRDILNVTSPTREDLKRVVEVENSLIVLDGEY